MLYREAMIEPTKVSTKIAKEIINHWDEIQLRHEIYPEVHVLAGTLVPVVSPYTTWFGG
jgi:hypothetical protein